MPRRNARGPQPAPDSFKRFLSENVRPPTHPEALAALDEPAPEPERISASDLIADPGRSLTRSFRGDGGTFEAHGPDYAGPKVKIKHAASAHLPAPTVATMTPQPYTAAGSGAQVVVSR